MNFLVHLFLQMYVKFYSKVSEFQRIVATLEKLLESTYRKTGRQTKRSIHGLAIRKLSWGAKELNAFYSLQDSLRHAIQLAHPNPNKTICVYNDASKQYWSGVVTQVYPAYLQLPICKQRHEPLAFLGGAFKRAELNWSTFEQEAYAIFQTFVKVDYLLMDEQPVHMFTDQRNLLFVLHLYGTFYRMTHHFQSAKMDHIFIRVQLHNRTRRRKGVCICWRLDTMDKRLEIHQNFNGKCVCNTTAAELNNIIFQWKTMAHSRAYSSFTRSPWFTSSLCKVRWWKFTLRGKKGMDSCWRCRIETQSTCSRPLWKTGNHEIDATASIIKDQYQWDGIYEDISNFLKPCIHCLVNRTGDIVPHSSGHQMHREDPNEVVYLNFLYMGACSTEDLYVLILRKDFSFFLWHFPFKKATKETT